MPANALEASLSPYLRLHKDNPVAWRTWGPEVMAEAQASGKPIFMSIGYSGCHWCHVMNEESFSDPETAELINTNFIPVLMDREERPDVDQFYQSAMPSLNLNGGWPLNLYLTPEGVPFFVHQFMPKEERLGLPAFRTVLNEGITRWTDKPDDVREQTAMLSNAVETLYGADLSAPPDT